MKRNLLTSVLVMAAASALAYHIHPDAKPGPEPGARAFSAAELEAQQSQIVALPDPTSVEDIGEKSEVPEVPTASGKATTLDAGTGDKGKPVDGAQVLRTVNMDLKNGNSGLWRAALGFLVCACVGFGGIAYVRNWAERNAPDPAKMNAASSRSTQKPKGR